jgi:WXXGXW repeat (2 copies)
MNLPLRALSVMALAATSLLSACIVVPARHYEHRPAVVYQNQPAPGGYDNDVVVVAPPTPQVEVVVSPPGPGFFWIGGYWNWVGGRHVWIGGRWEAHRHGYGWAPHQWHRHGNGWRQASGRWERR